MAEQKLNLNTVLAPVSWEQLEPEEGRFDFALVDGLVKQARQRGMRLVLLWFGSWKNGVSSYAPVWVKRDMAHFPRAKGSSSRNTKDILSTLSDANRQADARPAPDEHLECGNGRFSKGGLRLRAEAERQRDGGQ